MILMKSIHQSIIKYSVNSHKKKQRKKEMEKEKRKEKKKERDERNLIQKSLLDYFPKPRRSTLSKEALEFLAIVQRSKMKHVHIFTTYELKQSIKKMKKEVPFDELIRSLKPRYLCHLGDAKWHLYR
jgi:hypothetical protein